MDYPQRQVPLREDKRPGLGGMWLLLVPAACCGGPLIYATLAATGALAWGVPGLGLAAAVAAAMLTVVRRRRRRACCAPAPARAAQSAKRSLP